MAHLAPKGIAMRPGGRGAVSINDQQISERQADRIAGTRGARRLKGGLVPSPQAVRPQLLASW